MTNPINTQPPINQAPETPLVQKIVIVIFHYSFIFLAYTVVLLFFLIAQKIDKGVFALKLLEIDLLSFGGGATDHTNDFFESIYLLLFVVILPIHLIVAAFFILDKVSGLESEGLKMFFRATSLGLLTPLFLVFVVVWLIFLGANFGFYLRLETFFILIL